MSASSRKKKWTRKIQEPNKRVYLKFNLGDTVWFMAYDAIQKDYIFKILQVLDEEPTYTTINGRTMPERICFQSKQALINHLIIQYEKTLKETKC